MTNPSKNSSIEINTNMHSQEQHIKQWYMDTIYIYISYIPYIYISYMPYIYIYHYISYIYIYHMCIYIYITIYIYYVYIYIYVSLRNGFKKKKKNIYSKVRFFHSEFIFLKPASGLFRDSLELWNAALSCSCSSCHKDFSFFCSFVSRKYLFIWGYNMI